MAWLPVVGPGLLLYAGLFLVPVALGFALGFTSWNGLNPTINIVGLDNYFRIAGDEAFHRALITTFSLALVETVVINVGAILLAVLLNHPGPHYRVYRLIIFAPLVIAGVVVGFLWRELLYIEGPINTTLVSFGFEPIPFLTDPTLAFLSVGFVIAWQSIGFTTVIYLAALQAIPRDLYEAAEIDGAGSVAMLRHVTVPMLAPAITVNVVLVIISTMREYDHVFALTKGGPFGATETVVYRILAEGLDAGRLGKASAMSVVLTAIILAMTAIVVLLLRRRERAVE